METKKKIIIALGAILAIALLAYLVMYLYLVVLKKANKSDTGGNEGNGNSTSTGSASSGGTMPLWPLKYGSGIYNTQASLSGAQTGVRSIQRIANYYGIDLGKGGIDGKWGQDTEAAVAKLRELSLVASGVKPTKIFNNMIKKVESPLNSASQWQISKDNYNAMCQWFNSQKTKWTIAS